MTTPETLHHVTRLDRLGSIMREGLASPWGNYFSSTVEHACRFVAVRAMFEPEGWIVLEVNPEGLEVERSYDHNPDFFGTDDAWVVWSNVPPDAIKGAYEIEWTPPAATSE